MRAYVIGGPRRTRRSAPLSPGEENKVMKVDYWNYRRLHPEGKDHIKGWFDRAWHKRKCRDDKSFEPFILCWMAFNSWAACVTDEDRDWRIIESLSADKVLTSGFAALVAKNQAFAELAQSFRAWWPIFQVKELRRLKVFTPHSNDRRQVVEFYFKAGSLKYTPNVSDREPLVGNDIPLHWKNAIEALYQVRCNLMHGDKRLSSEADQQIVGAAFRVLIQFFRHCLEAPEAFDNL